MALSKTLSTLLLAGGASYASSLAVYQDHTFYTYTPSDTFIGFSQGVSAKCEGSTVALEAMSTCPEGDRLCKELKSLQGTELEFSGIQSNMKMIDQLVSLPRPTEFDASAWINAARLIGEEQANLSHKEEKLRKEIERKKQAFRKKAPTQQALETTETCNKELELTIPYGYVSFSTNYEANIVDDKEVTVTQNLSIVNRSGVDIEADTAMFYYRSAHQYVNPIHFNPWIVSKYVPKPKRVYKKSMMRKESADMPMMSEEMVMGSIVPRSAPLVTYEDAREYKIQNLMLPSAGLPLEVKVITWKAPLDCEVRAYPYVNARAFHVCSFEPKFQIDANRWKITSNTEVINENAAGEYRDSKYNLYTKVEEDIKIIRKPIVLKERETGIFGGTARKKDGFTLKVTNKSDTPKTLTITERIPTSTTEEIKVKLLEVRSDKKVNYKLLKDGEIEIKLTLAAHENKTIEVLFEISYDKDLKVSY